MITDEELEGVLNLCRQLESNGDISSSISFLSEAIQKYDAPVLYLQRGLRYEEIQQDNLAFDDYDTAVKMDQENIVYIVARAGILAKDTRTIPRAVAELQLVVARAPSYMLAKFLLYICFRRLGDFTSAIDLASDLVDLEPTNPCFRQYLGQCYIRLSQYAKGIVELKKALDISPELPDVWFNLGIAYLGSGELYLALAALQRSIDIAPSFLAYLELASVYLRCGELDKSSATLQEAKCFVCSEDEEKLHSFQKEALRKAKNEAMSTNDR